MSTTIQSKWKGLFFSMKSDQSKSKLSLTDLSGYYFIYDCQSQQITYVSEGFSDITDYPISFLTVENLEKIIHPEDQEFFYQNEEKAATFAQKLFFDEQMQYTFNFNFRIVTKKQSSILVRQSSQILDVDVDGQPITILISHQKMNESSRIIADHNFKIFDKNRKMFLDADNIYKLTKREFEIINLVKRGFNSVEIADKLNTSKYTIDTHRKNILNKTNSVNFIELLRKLQHVA